MSTCEKAFLHFFFFGNFLLFQCGAWSLSPMHQSTPSVEVINPRPEHRPGPLDIPGNLPSDFWDIWYVLNDVLRDFDAAVLPMDDLLFIGANLDEVASYLSDAAFTGRIAPKYIYIVNPDPTEMAPLIQINPDPQKPPVISAEELKALQKINPQLEKIFFFPMEAQHLPHYFHQSGRFNVGMIISLFTLQPDIMSIEDIRQTELQAVDLLAENGTVFIFRSIGFDDDPLQKADSIKTILADTTYFIGQKVRRTVPETDTLHASGQASA